MHLFQVHPPRETIAHIWPVTDEAASEARYTINGPTLAGFIGRPQGATSVDCVLRVLAPGRLTDTAVAVRSASLNYTESFSCLMCAGLAGRPAQGRTSSNGVTWTAVPLT